MTRRALFYIISCGFILVSAFLIFPLFMWSFGRYWFFPDLLPSQITGQEWREIIVFSAPTARAFFNSFTIALSVTLLNIIIALPVARFISRLRGRIIAAADLIILLPLIVPAVTVVLGTYSLFVFLNINDTIVAVLVAHLMPTLPYMIIIQRGIFVNLNEGYLQSARTLGASAFYLFFHVTLPLIVPGLLVGGLFVFLISWSQYLSSLIFGGGRIITLPMLLFASAGAGDLARTSSITIIMLLPVFLLLLLNAVAISGRGYAKT